MRNEQLLRKLAKDIRYMNLFEAAQKVNGINLFKNNTDFSDMQQLFLSYLYFYHGLYLDLAMKKVSKSVLDNEIFEDAYTYWRNNHTPKDKKQQEGKKQDLKLVFDSPERVRGSNGRK